jgi:NAD(P)H dehydrogenase (quinone)
MVEAYIERSGIGWTQLHPGTFMQNLLISAGIEGTKSSVITQFIGDARPTWIDTDDLGATAAAVLREPGPHAGRTYGLATEVASVNEIASLIAEVTGVPWRYEPREPEEFFRTMTATGADPVYMACVRNVFERARNGSLPEISDTFDTFERLTGRAPTSLRAFVEKHRATFSYDRPST